MSIRIMTLVWDSEVYAGGTLLVLLALADFAGDDGKRIYPHVDTLAKKARLSVRATQMALETLRVDGILEAVANAVGGRGKAVEYEMNMERVQNLRPDVKGAIDDTKGCNPQQERVQSTTERVQSATSHIDNHQEPSKNHQVEPPAPAAPMTALHPKPSRPPKEYPDWLDREAWDGYGEMRRRIRKPMTDRAEQLILNKLDRWRMGGHDPTAILDASTASSWTDVYEPKGERNGRNTGQKSGATIDQHMAGIAEIVGDIRRRAV